MTTGPQSNLSAPAGYSSSDLVFSDNFSGTTLDKNWHPYLASNGSSGGPWNSIGSGDSTEGGLYMAQADVPSHVSVDNGLTLTTTEQSIVGKNGSASQTYPYTSGAVSSYGSFEFTGGYLQISMQQPSGDGSWPALWMVPGQGAGNAGIAGDNFEIDLQEGNYTSGSSNPNNNVAWHLHTPAGVFGGVTTAGTNLSSGFNTYAIDWEPGKSITWYLNGQEVGQITSAQAPIPDEPMEVIMDNAVGNSASSGFRTVADSSTPSVMPMEVGDVQLYQKPGSGETVLGANVTAAGGTTKPTATVTSSSGSTSSGGSVSKGATLDGTTTGTGTSSTSSGSTGTGTGADSGPSGGATPPVAPVLNVADHSLNVSPGKTVALGRGVSIPKTGDNVTVNTRGGPNYETSTDNLDHGTVSGSNITLAAAGVSSGVSLSSNHGPGQPSATLPVTATDHTWTATTSAAQSILVEDHLSSPVSRRSGSGPTPSGSTGSSASGSSSHDGWPATGGNGHHVGVSQWFDQHPGFAKAVNTLSESIASRSSAGSSSATPAASAGEKAFALLSQMMAGDFGNTSRFAQAGTSTAHTQQQTENLLTRPLH